MKMLIFCALSLMTAVAHASEQRIYQTDKYGNIQYQKPSYTVKKDGRIIEMDKFGNKQHQKPQHQIKAGTVYQTDKYGNIQYHKAALLEK